MYKRVMLKLSGEALGGEAGAGLDQKAITAIAGEVRDAAAARMEELSERPSNTRHGKDERL